MLNIPYFQRKVTVVITRELSNYLGTKLTIDRVDLGLFNHIILDNVNLKDRQGHPLLKASRLSASFDLLPLLTQQKVSLRSVQLYNFRIALTKTNPNAPLNCQFVIDAFKSKKPKKESHLDLRVNSLLVRHGSVSYDLLSDPYQFPDELAKRRFNSHHLSLSKIQASISLKHLTNDSLSATVKRLSFKEQSGLELKRLHLKVHANSHKAQIEDLDFQLPNTHLHFAPIEAHYKSFKALKNIGDSIRWQCELFPSEVRLSDLGALVPALRSIDSPLYFNAKFEGSLNDLTLKNLYLATSHDEISLYARAQMSDLLKKQPKYVDAEITSLRLSEYAPNFIFRALSSFGIKQAPIWNRLGTIQLKAHVDGYLATNLKANVSLYTALGTLKATAHYRKVYTAEKTSHIEVHAQTDEVNLGKLLDKEIFGLAALDAKASGTLSNGKFSSFKIQGTVPHIQYKGHDYQKLAVDGLYSSKGFDGLVSIDDELIKMDAKGLFNLIGKQREYHLNAHVQHFKPYQMGLIKNHKETIFSFNVNANLQGNKVNDILGALSVDSLVLHKPDGKRLIDHMNLRAYQEGGVRKIEVLAPFLAGHAEGHFEYSTLPNSIAQMLSKYTPSLLDISKQVKPQNNITFSFVFENTEPLTELLDIPLTIYQRASLNGFIDDATHTLKIEGDFPSFDYGTMRLRHTTLRCENTPQHFNCSIGGGLLMRNDLPLNLALQVEATENQLTASMHWENQDKILYRGQLTTEAKLTRDPLTRRVTANIQINPTEVVLHDSIWQVSRAQIQIDSAIHVQNFELAHARQHIRVEGIASRSANDSLVAELEQVNLTHIFNILNFHPIEFGGIATGRGVAHHLLRQPIIEAKLEIPSFKINYADVGHAFVKGYIDLPNDDIVITGDMEEKDLSTTHVVGSVYPKRKGLDLHIKAKQTNVAFIQPYVKTIISELHGRATGNFRLFGGFKTLNVEGDGVGDASFKIDLLGVTYSLRDSIHLRPEEFYLTKAKVYDAEGHPGTVDARLRHKNFRNFNYSLRVQAEDMQVMNLRESFDLPFYGRVYGNGNAYLTGNDRRLDITAAMQTTDKTEFCYKLTEARAAGDNRFVHFIDSHTPKDTLSTPVVPAVPEKEQMDVRLNLLCDAGSQSVMKVIIDPKAGDYISCTGTGNIRMEYYNKGDLQMFGTYTLNQGVYKFSLQEVIRKDFTMRSGSSLTFNGNPYSANCDIHALYTVNSVSLRDLGTDVVSAVQNAQTNVRVNCLMDITGAISQPDIRLGIELPNENEEVQRVVRNFISTDDQMNMQILYLLGIGKFYTPDYANHTGQSSNAMSSVLSSTLSGQLNSMLSQVIGVRNWNFGVNGSTGEQGWTDMELQGMLSGQLLNNRLLLNGNFGYRGAATTSSTTTTTAQQTGFIGDFDLEYLLTKGGDIRMKAYNKNNDRYSTKQTLNTQGIGVIFKRDFDSYLELLPWHKKNRKKNLK